jgi:transcriptional regulator with XRE-family HTH domain
MTTIWNYVQFKPSERPKYTRYELAKMVSEKRESLGLLPEETAEKFGMSVAQLKTIEGATRSFNVAMYIAISSILDVSIEALLEKETDDMATVSFRADAQNSEVDEAVRISNMLFDEIIMQQKISIR